MSFRMLAKCITCQRTRPMVRYAIGWSKPLGCDAIGTYCAYAKELVNGTELQWHCYNRVADDMRRKQVLPSLPFLFCECL